MAATLPQTGLRCFDQGNKIAMQSEFTSWLAYHDFARSVRRERRYVWTAEQNAFLATVRATTRNRDLAIAEGRIFYRAQRGTDWHTETGTDGELLADEPMGYGADRMKPRVNQAVERRRRQFSGAGA